MLASVLPKRKKDFASGRPIVSFVDAFMRPLLEATSRLLHRICSLAFPQAFSKGDVYELLNQVREFFQSGTTEKLHCRNQDLVGFFNSISQSQFLQAWRITLEFYRQRHGAQADTTFSVNLKDQRSSCEFSAANVAPVLPGRLPSGAKTYQPSYDTPLHCSASKFQLETSANASAHPWAPPFHPPYAGWWPRKKKSGGALSTSAAPT